MSVFGVSVLTKLGFEVFDFAMLTLAFNVHLSLTVGRPRKQLKKRAGLRRIMDCPVIKSLAIELMQT